MPDAHGFMTLPERLRQMGRCHESAECPGGRHWTWAAESIEAADRIDRLELALHRIAGHANITGEKARAVAEEALSRKTS